MIHGSNTIIVIVLYIVLYDAEYSICGNFSERRVIKIMHDYFGREDIVCKMGEPCYVYNIVIREKA